MTEETTHPPKVPHRPINLLCGRPMSGDPAYYPRAEYRGHLIYFCTESCLGAFNADPDAFYTAHSRTAPPKPQ